MNAIVIVRSLMNEHSRRVHLRAHFYNDRAEIELVGPDSAYTLEVTKLEFRALAAVMQKTLGHVGEDGYPPPGLIEDMAEWSQESEEATRS